MHDLRGVTHSLLGVSLGSSLSQEPQAPLVRGIQTSSFQPKDVVPVQTSRTVDVGDGFSIFSVLRLRLDAVGRGFLGGQGWKNMREDH